MPITIEKSISEIGLFQDVLKRVYLRKMCKVGYRLDGRNREFTIPDSLHNSVKKRVNTLFDSILSKEQIVYKSVVDSSGIPDRPCVYFLLLNGDITYIGQTVSIKRRLNDHKKDKFFDKFCVEYVSRDEMSLKEMIYINKYLPPLNTNYYDIEDILFNAIGDINFYQFSKLGKQRIKEMDIQDQFAY